jgi:hypothetical protein
MNYIKITMSMFAITRVTMRSLQNCFNFILFDYLKTYFNCRMQELCVDPQHFESKTLLPNVQYLWWMDAGALCGSPTFRKQNTVTKCAISVVDGGAVFEAKQTTRQTIVIDNYDSFTHNLCQVKATFCCVTSGRTLRHIMVTSDIS